MELLGITDLTKRWNYTKQRVHRKIKVDSTFPKPIALINDGCIIVFTLSDILAYEKNHKELIDQSYKKWSSRKGLFYAK